MSLLRTSAVEIAALIRRREISPVEVAEAHIRRIEAVNPSINALVADRFESAMAEARAAERRLMTRDELPPLFGVPCTIKEFIAVAGMPQTGGIVAHRDRVADTDSVVVSRLRRAGAIVLGVTNVPEGGLWLETVNALYGRSLHPRDPRHTPGGSSGGEAAIVAAGGSPFGIGSDVGGSIRIPASFCGTVGHKPTGRLVPNDGHFPPPSGALDAYLTCGPLARRVGDLAAVLDVIAGGEDRPRFDRSALDQVDLSEVVVMPVIDDSAAPVGPQMRRALRTASQSLAARGARFQSLGVSLARSFRLWAALMLEAGGPSYSEILGGGRAIRPFLELLRFGIGRRKHTLPALIIAVTEKLPGLTADRIERLADAGRDLARQLADELGPNGVLLHAPFPRPAPRHHTPMLTPFDFVCTGLFNVLELPATVVPVAQAKNGMPMAVQVVGGPARDHLTLAVARALEEDLGGWSLVTPTAQPKG